MANLPETIPDTLSSVRTRPLFLARLQAAAPYVVGAVPAGERRATFIEGGRFEGERLRGTVGKGIDWQTIRADGAMTLDVKVLLQPEAGGLIAMRYTGLRAGPKDVMEALARGESVDPASYYFRIEASFETSAPDFLWLNSILAVGIGHRFPDGPLYNVFELL